MDHHRHGISGQADHDPPAGRLAREDRLPRLDGDLVQDLPDPAGGKAIGHDVHVPHGYAAREEEKVAGESLADLRRDGFPVVLYDPQVPDLPEARPLSAARRKWALLLRIMGPSAPSHGSTSSSPVERTATVGRL